MYLKSFRNLGNEELMILHTGRAAEKWNRVCENVIYL